jgi:hypothetical protein
MTGIDWFLVFLAILWFYIAGWIVRGVLVFLIAKGVSSWVSIMKKRLTNLSATNASGGLSPTGPIPSTDRADQTIPKKDLAG